MKITPAGIEQITAKFIEFTGKPAPQDRLDDMCERAATQFAHRDSSPVQVGLGDWQTKSGQAALIEFPLNFFILPARN